MTFAYDIALSFAGEDREFAEAVAEGLSAAGVRVFYDSYKEAELWGEDLSIKFQEIYRDQSQYCIMIVSAAYLEKMWTILERRHAIERVITNKGEAYILPVRLDGFLGEVPGLPGTIGYVPAKRGEPQKIVSIFLAKIGIEYETIEVAQEDRKKVAPKLPPREFSDKDKNDFLTSSFEEIVNTLDGYGHTALREQPDLEYELERVTSRKMVFTLYRSGKELLKFKVWRGGMLGSDAISFAHGKHLDVENDNTMNEQFSVAEDGDFLKLSPMGMLSMGSVGERRLMTPSEAVEYLWENALKYV